MQIPQDTARIDLDRAGQSVLFIRLWKKGYNTDDAGAPDKEDIITGEISLTQILEHIEKQGFSVTVTGASARCLRGETTRVDFVKQTDGWHIKKYVEGWTASTRPMSNTVKTEEQINEAIAWCESNGWTVRKWQGGARAWKGQPKPVRNAHAIRQMREQAREELRRGKVGTNKIFYDFAYDF